MKKRKVRVRTPSKTKVVKKKKKPKIARCALCKRSLQGIKRYTQSQLKNIDPIFQLNFVVFLSTSKNML